MAKADPEQIAGQQAEGLIGRARTLSGDNLKGSVQVVSLAELKTMMRGMLVEHGGVDEDALKQREAQLQEAFSQREAELQNRIRELESQLGESAQAQDDAVAAAKQQMQGRISELEAILANDDARSRAAFLEQEVQRLQALIDRYETDLEAITSIDHAAIADDLSLCDELQSRFSGELAERIGFIKLHLQGADRALTEGVSAINEKQQGSVYSCFDLLERAVELRHLQHELLSIKQASS